MKPCTPSCIERGGDHAEFSFHTTGAPALAGLLALALGLLLYWVERDASRTLLIPRFDTLQARGTLPVISGWLPSLLHTLAFGLLTAAAMPRRRAWRLGAVAAWAVVNVAFEIGQHPTIASTLTNALLDRAEPGLVVQALAAYVHYGRFDPNDIAAAVAGAAVAAASLLLLDRSRGAPDAPNLGVIGRVARSLGVATFVAGGLVSLVGSGGGGVEFGGFPPCTESWCNQPPSPIVVVDPPYTTAQVGSAVVFTANIENFSGTPTFQWSRSHVGQKPVVLPGETGRTLTIPAVSLVDDQSYFFVKVTGADGLPRQAAAALTVSSMPGIVFVDGEFDPAQWQATPREYPPGSVPVISESQEASGGNPGAWRRMTYGVPAGAGVASVLYLRNDAVYDPAVDGGIYVIDFTEDCRMLQDSETTFAQTQLAVEQAGRRYVAEGGGICNSTAWSAGTRRSSLRAGDFTLVNGPACGATEACPDYSANAPALRLGFLRVVWGAPGDTIGHGVDNWKVTVWRR